MTYSVQNTDGSKTINVAASQVNSSFSVALVGRNVSGYGQYFVQNAVRHLENFASTSAPSDSVLLTGQIWYDKNESVMRVYDGSGWRRMSATVSATAPSGGVASGTTYYSTVDDKIKIHNGSGFVEASYAGKVSNEYSSDSAVGSPTKYGSRLRTMYIPDDTGVYKAVLALMYVSDGTGTAGFTNGESIMAIFSDHTAFTVHPSTAARVEELGDVAIQAELTDSQGIGTSIKPGMNLRKKYAGTAVALANVAQQADTANAIQISGSSYNASTIFRSGSTALLPDTTDAVTIGNVSNRFSTLYIDTIQVGDASSNTAQYIKKAGANVVLDIGESAAPIHNLHVKDITLASGGGITGLNVESFGTSAKPIDTAFISNVASGTFHLTNAGLYANLVNAGGSVVFDPSSGQVVQLTTAQTLTNKTLDGETSAADNAATLGNAGTKFGTVFSSLFSGTTSTVTGTSTAATFTDDTLTITGGTITGGVASTFSGNVAGQYFNGTGVALSGTATAGALTDGTLTISSGAITSGVSATFSGNVTGAYFNGVATSAQFADLAERYNADADYLPGTVVAIGGNMEITGTTSHMDTNVFGVISTAPAYLMNAESDGLPVALAGRVPVNVIGKIKKGDRLVSSDVPGLAWALGEDDVYDARAIIGRSLEDKLDGDEGVIEAAIGIK